MCFNNNSNLISVLCVNNGKKKFTIVSINSLLNRKHKTCGLRKKSFIQEF